MLPRRRALELASRRCSSISAPRRSHVDEVSACAASFGDWASLRRPERDGGSSSSTSASDGVVGLVFSPPRSPLARLQRGFAASAPSLRDRRTDESDRRDETGAPSSSPPPSPLSSHWLSRVLPRRLWPFAELARLDKPAGTWLLAWPCCWSIVLGASGAGAAVDETARLLALFGAGAVLLRGAGCTINDLWDRDFDKKVSRTASRPLARGAVSPGAAVGFLGAQLSAGAAVLAQLPPGAVAVGAASLPLVAAYPLAKRVTDWPQAVLGLTFNWGALLGWAAVVGGNAKESLIDLVERAKSAGDASVALDPLVDALSSPLLSSGLLSSPAPWLLYASGICWTLCYDTIYAYQDARDDARIGIKSSALSLRRRGSERAGVAAFGAAAVALLAAAGEAGGVGNLPFYASVLLGPGAHMAWQCSTLDPSDADNCAKRFKSNAVFGGLASAAIAVGVAAM